MEREEVIEHLLNKKQDNTLVIKTGERGTHGLFKLLRESEVLDVQNDTTNVVSIWRDGGVIATLVIDPFQDDRRYNKMVHPAGGVSESYVYHFYNRVE
tara:strand:- start:2750 stop:3043 length:294 start_codon:yes stop_codon:yes gene_type:complete